MNKNLTFLKIKSKHKNDVSKYGYTKYANWKIVNSWYDLKISDLNFIQNSHIVSTM